jgi:methionyl-tRNA synthetase
MKKLMATSVKAAELSHNATDLINPKSAITGNTPTLKETKHWFLPLNKHEEFLREWILKGHKKGLETQCLRASKILDR